MAYLLNVASSIDDLISSMEGFAAANGWQVIAKDSKAPILPAVVNNNSIAINPRCRTVPNAASLAAVKCPFSIGRNVTSPQETLSATRLVLKDPNGAYFHIFGIYGLTGWIDGVDAQALSFLEVWISDDWAGDDADVHAHAGLTKIGLGGPYRESFEGCHLFTGQNKYNNKLYFNVALETIAGSFEHFNFGTIETYFDMDCGEFCQASCQSIGQQYKTGYDSGAIGSAWYSFLCNSFGRIGVANSSINSISSIDLNLTETARLVSGTATNPDIVNCVIVRYSQPQWARHKALLLNQRFNFGDAAFNPVGAVNEFLVQPHLLANIPGTALTPNFYSGVSVFTPAYVAMYSPVENNYWGLMGHFPNQRLCNIINNNPKDIVTYGTDDWMLFPLNRKGPTEYNGSWPAVSGDLGVAYCK